MAAGAGDGDRLARALGIDAHDLAERAAARIVALDDGELAAIRAPRDLAAADGQRARVEVAQAPAALVTNTWKPRRPLLAITATCAPSGEYEAAIAPRPDDLSVAISPRQSAGSVE